MFLSRQLILFFCFGDFLWEISQSQIQFPNYSNATWMHNYTSWRWHVLFRVEVTLKASIWSCSGCCSLFCKAAFCSRFGSGPSEKVLTFCLRHKVSKVRASRPGARAPNLHISHSAAGTASTVWKHEAKTTRDASSETLVRFMPNLHRFNGNYEGNLWWRLLYVW